MNFENIYDYDIDNPWENDGSLFIEELELDDLIDEIQENEVI